MLTFFQSYQKHFESYQKAFGSYQMQVESYQMQVGSYQMGLQCLRLEAHLAGFALAVVPIAASEPLQFGSFLESRRRL
jgi:hypothetical protein